MALLFLLLLFPRATAPEAMPMPAVDERALARAERADRELATAAAKGPLPSRAREVGSAIRALNKARVEGAEPGRVYGLGEQLTVAIAELGAAGELRELARLRAVQLEAFLREARELERTGAPSAELVELAGDFAGRMRSVGWLREGRLVLDEHERRVLFKAMWNALVAIPSEKEIELSLDETRALYRLYLRAPHGAEMARAALDSRRAAARTDAECRAADREERRAAELWRADKIRRLGAIDRDYPTAFALGVAYYRAGDYARSSDAFRAYLDAHPSGPWSIRARNHLRAALREYGAY